MSDMTLIDGVFPVPLVTSVGESVRNLSACLARADGIRLSRGLLEPEAVEEAMGAEAFALAVERTDRFATLAQLDTVSRFVLELAALVPHGDGGLLGAPAYVVDGTGQFPYLRALGSLFETGGGTGPDPHVLDGFVKCLSLCLHDGSSSPFHTTDSTRQEALR